jgi:hypothetical protein
MNMMSPTPHPVSKDLQTALGRFGVVFAAPVPVSPARALYDANGLWLNGVANVAAWGMGCGRGIAYQDHGPVTDGQKGAVRKLGGSRKPRGMASDGLFK